MPNKYSNALTLNNSQIKILIDGLDALQTKWETKDRIRKRTTSYVVNQHALANRTRSALLKSLGMPTVQPVQNEVIPSKPEPLEVEMTTPQVEKPDERVFEMVWDKRKERCLLNAAEHGTFKAIKKEGTNVFETFILRGNGIWENAGAMDKDPEKALRYAMMVAALENSTFAITQEKAKR